MSTENISLGKKGEIFVAQWLEKNNYKILATNYKLRYGEIDIIAKKDEVIAFVEVKFRKNAAHAFSEIVNFKKQNKIALTAKVFMMENNLTDYVLRFDIALLYLLKTDLNSDYKIDYYPNAFVPSFF